MFPQVGEDVHVVQVAVDGVKVLQEDKNTEIIQFMLLFRFFLFFFVALTVLFFHIYTYMYIILFWCTDIILYKKNNDAFYNERSDQ